MWPPKKRQRVTRACDLCKGRKKQCSGTQPCTTCLSKSASCTFSTPNQLQNRHQHHQRLSPYPYPRSSLPPHELSDEDVGDSLETPLYHKSAPSHKWSAGSGLDHAHSHAPALKLLGYYISCIRIIRYIFTRSVMSKAPPSRLRKTEEPFVNLRHPVTPISDKTALYGKP